jgi:hypothetical protein
MAWCSVKAQGQLYLYVYLYLYLYLFLEEAVLLTPHYSGVRLIVTPVSVHFTAPVKTRRK